MSALEGYLAELRSFKERTREEFVDHGRIYDAIHDDLGDLEQFAAMAARWL